MLDDSSAILEDETVGGKLDSINFGVVVKTQITLCSAKDGMVFKRTDDIRQLGLEVESNNDIKMMIAN